MFNDIEHFKYIENTKNKTAHEANEAHKRALERFDRLQKDMYKYV